MMRSLNLSELAPILGASLLGSDCQIDAVSTDSRQALDDALFIALQGESFDGHDFVDAAAQQGAAAALVSKSVDTLIPCLKVADTRHALGQLGQLNRSYFQGRMVGITGSSGKTTVKNMLTSICAQQGATHATGGNYNNEIGVPLTLLGLAPEHQYAVIEMGASKRGDIEYLVRLAQPQVSVLLNAQPAHLEGFGSLQGVAETKGEIYGALSDTGVAVLNLDSEFSDYWKQLIGDRTCITFSRVDKADVTAEEIDDQGALGSRFALCFGDERASVSLALPGDHNVTNSLAAAAAAIGLGIVPENIVAGLEAVRPVPGRLLSKNLAPGYLLIDDTYNANPGSVRAAIDVLAATPARRRILILGFMGELGQESDAHHRAVGGYAAERGIDDLWLVGDAAIASEGFGDGARTFADKTELIASAGFAEGDAVLVKGSRSAGMEEIVNSLNPERGGA